MESISISRDDRGRFSSDRVQVDPEHQKQLRDFYSDRWELLQVVQENEYTYLVQEGEIVEPLDTRKEWERAFYLSTVCVGIFLYLS